MNILMIGGTKFIGLEVARQLSVAGHAVTLFHRSYAESLPYPQIKGACSNPDALKGCIDNINPDCIIHMTAMEAEKGKSEEVYNLADKETFTELEWYHKIANSLNWNGKIRVTEEENSDYNYSQHLIMDTSKICYELGFEEIYTAEEHLQEIVRNMK